MSTGRSTHQCRRILARCHTSSCQLPSLRSDVFTTAAWCRRSSRPLPGPRGSVAGQSLLVISVDSLPCTLHHSAPGQQHSLCPSLWGPASLFSWMVERRSCVSLLSGLVRGRAESWDNFSEIAESKGVSKRPSEQVQRYLVPDPCRPMNAVLSTFSASRFLYVHLGLEYHSGMQVLRGEDHGA